jgi:ribosomal protein S12 methylthiotransferase accessory factor
MEGSQEFVDFGSGAHFDARIALLRAMTELNQFLSIGLMGGRSQNPSSQDPDQGSIQGPSQDGFPPFRLKDHSYLTPSDGPAVQSGFGPSLGANLDAQFSGLDTRAQVSACVNLAKREGFDFLVLDQTRPDIEVPVVRVIVPGLRHFYRRFAPGRLYDVPVNLRWRDKPLSEKELNPLHPQT